MTSCGRFEASSAVLGDLRVRIIECDKLPKMDLFGLSDPFVQLKYQATPNSKVQEHYTPVIRKTLSPKWNWEHTLEVTDMHRAIQYPQPRILITLDSWY